ncbi:rhodanese-like domain-containing protein [Nonomuraea polychroma]|uniref:rhodanese-like domain-containing protein n=1 Tax=Nonomuraea polychroma TaxID=46176 RepID=UPI0019D433AF
MTVIDVRPYEEYAAGHIAEAISILLNYLADRSRICRATRPSWPTAVAPTASSHMRPSVR